MRCIFITMDIWTSIYGDRHTILFLENILLKESKQGGGGALSNKKI
jgi:hypothetical protein